MNWKKAFDEEMLLLKSKVKEADTSKKLTGKELFMTDMTLNESDLKFLEEGKNYCMLTDPPNMTYTAHLVLKVTTSKWTRPCLRIWTNWIWMRLKMTTASPHTL
jgi:hypothetical protein